MEINYEQCHVFIDYDNLPQELQRMDVVSLLTEIIYKIPFEHTGDTIQCNIRIYGGWYEDINPTRKAQKLQQEIFSEFPQVMNIPHGEHFITLQVNAELAKSLLQEPHHHLFATYRKKNKITGVRIATKDDVGCTDENCILPLLKKFIRSGKCPKNECEIDYNGIITRFEQKLVDTMLSCDFIFSSLEGVKYQVLVSSDDDFFPPLRSAELISDEKIIRIHTKENTRRYNYTRSGTRIIEMELRHAPI